MASTLAGIATAFVRPRDIAPDFSNVPAVLGLEFTKLSLKDYRGKYLVLVFYPFDFTYVCPTELIAFSEAIGQFRAINTEVVGVSTDSHFTHLAWVKTARTEGGLGKIEYPLMADFSKEVSKNYGVLIDNQEDSMFGAALRGIFIIDESGKVRSV
mgnify:CR=1 FL=1